MILNNDLKDIIRRRYSNEEKLTDLYKDYSEGKTHDFAINEAAGILYILMQARKYISSALSEKNTKELVEKLSEQAIEILMAEYSLENGSWDDNMHKTALAIRALLLYDKEKYAKKMEKSIVWLKKEFARKYDVEDLKWPYYDYEGVFIYETINIYENKETGDKKVQNKNEKKRIFIGSSSNADVLARMDEIAVLLEGLGCIVRKWNDVIDPVFKVGEYTFESVLNIANETDGAVFIFNEDDETWFSNKEEKLPTVRDNVILEYGVFAGRHGRKSAAILAMGNPKMASDLEGLTYARADDGNNSVREWLRTWLKELNK